MDVSAIGAVAFGVRVTFIDTELPADLRDFVADFNIVIGCADIQVERIRKWLLPRKSCRKGLGFFLTKVRLTNASKDLDTITRERVSGVVDAEIRRIHAIRHTIIKHRLRTSVAGRIVGKSAVDRVRYDRSFRRYARIVVTQETAGALQEVLAQVRRTVGGTHRALDLQ